MRVLKLILPLMVLAGPALAQGVPKTLTLPTDLVTQIVKYLGARPFEEVQPLMVALQGCASVQIPQGGAVISHGQCPEVTEFLAARNAPPASVVAASPLPAKPLPATAPHRPFALPGHPGAGH